MSEDAANIHHKEAAKQDEIRDNMFYKALVASLDTKVHTKITNEHRNIGKYGILLLHHLLQQYGDVKMLSV